MKVCVFRSSDGACDYYRAVLPIQTCEINRKVEKRELWISNILATMLHSERKFLDAMNSDVYLFQRVAGSSVINKIRDFTKKSGINPLFVMDHDDDVFNVSPMQQAYATYGTEEIKIIHNGKTIHEWKDGVNIHIAENKHYIDEIKRSCEKMDLITVTTEHLAGIYRVYNENVKVLPNCVDLNEWNRLNIRRKNPDEIRIGWAGGASHFEDITMIREPLKEIATKYPNVKIVMVGYMPKTMEKDYRDGQFEFHPWRETSAHPYRMAALDLDIGVILLTENPFSQAISPIKWIEFSSLQIPCVTSYVSPYNRINDADDLDKGIFVEKNNLKMWFTGIELLINNTLMRKNMGTMAREFVKANYDINTQYHRWIDAYEEARCRSLQTQPS